eukprot:GHUV01057324.1.p3 GENE.GHUV01057324.1~~GHUV01057324.1.p3  ORF type:complete len:101 (+),score=3.09 GHUV01057324.1:428-730(+)
MACQRPIIVTTHQTELAGGATQRLLSLTSAPGPEMLRYAHDSTLSFHVHACIRSELCLTTFVCIRTTAAGCLVYNVARHLRTGQHGAACSTPPCLHLPAC